MARVVALVEDLMFASRITAAARGSGTGISTARSPEALIGSCAGEPPALVLVDLDAARLEPIRAIAALRADPNLAGLEVVGFVSHVDEATARAAAAAGCSRVLPRGSFVRELPGILAGAAAR